MSVHVRPPNRFSKNTIYFEFCRSKVKYCETQQLTTHESRMDSVNLGQKVVRHGPCLFLGSSDKDQGHRPLEHAVLLPDDNFRLLWLGTVKL